MLRWIVLLTLMFVSAAHAQWTVELTRDAGAYVRYDGTSVVKFKYVAWGPQWKAADFSTAIGPNQNNTWSIKGDIKGLSAVVEGLIRHEGNKLTWQWDTQITKASKGNIGAGLEFDLRLDPQVFGKDVPKPQLLENGAGWTWTPKPGQTITARFDGGKQKAYFEKGKLDTIRTMFLPADLDEGKQTTTMTLELPPNTQRVDGVSKRYGKADENWLAKTIDWTTSPIDLSYLNDKPAGKRGFVRVDGDKLVYGDGSEARFWGCNVQAYALFNATNEAIEQQAKRIAALGFNLVRIHHHDSAEWSPSVIAKDAPNTQQLDEANLDRIDYWVKCLKDNGVYVWMDLHVGRPFREGDGIDAFDELNPGKTGRQGKGYNYVNVKMTQRMKEFADAYLTRTNRYTQTKYVDEPALMGVLLTNENDITNHFGNNFLENKHKPQHEKLYEKIRDTIIGERKLDAGKSWQTWEPGPSKVVLNDVEYHWDKDFIDHLRSIGLKVPIATTNTWGNNPLFSLPALTAGDVIDVHAYGQAESLSSNPKYDDMSTHWIAAAQVAGKPLIITEWNTEYPQRDRYTQALFIAANAAFQGWDAPMLYGYHQAPLVPQSKLDAWTTSNDPSHMALMPAAALLYREGHVKPAEKTVVFAPGEDLLMKSITPENSIALRTIAERHRLVIGLPTTPLLPWLKGVSKGDVSDPQHMADGVGETSITSDTGELTRDWKAGTYTINTPRSQVAEGWIGGREITLADVTFKLDTPKAAIAVTSLDGKPIATSKKLLLSFAGQSQSVGKPAVIRTEPIVGSVKVKGAALHVTPLTPQGKPIATTDAGNGVVTLDGKTPTHWIVLTRD